MTPTLPNTRLPLTKGTRVVARPIRTCYSPPAPLSLLFLLFFSCIHPFNTQTTPGLHRLHSLATSHILRSLITASSALPSKYYTIQIRSTSTIKMRYSIIAAPIALAASVSAGDYATSYEVVSTLTTYCSSATSLSINGKIHTVTEVSQALFVFSR